MNEIEEIKELLDSYIEPDIDYLKTLKKQLKDKIRLVLET